MTTAEKIKQQLILKGESQSREIAEQVGVSDTHTRWTLDGLIRDGQVCRVKKEGFVFYSAVVTSGKPSFLDVMFLMTVNRGQGCQAVRM